MLPVTVLHVDGQVRPQPQHLHQQRELLLAVLAGTARTAFVCCLSQQHRLQDRLVARNARFYSRLLNKSGPVKCLCFSLGVFFATRLSFLLWTMLIFVACCTAPACQTGWCEKCKHGELAVVSHQTGSVWMSCSHWTEELGGLPCAAARPAVFSLEHWLAHALSLRQVGFQPHLWDCEELKVKNEDLV